MTLKQLLDLLYQWSADVSNGAAEQETSVCSDSVQQWFHFIREVCSADLIANSVVLGGPGTVVAIDESVVARRKPGNIQGRPMPEMWVFGGVKRGTEKFFMRIVPRRAMNELPIAGLMDLVMCTRLSITVSYMWIRLLVHTPTT